MDRIRQNFDATGLQWRNAVADYLLIPSDASAADTIPFADDSSTPMPVDTPAQSPVRQPIAMPIYIPVTCTSPIRQPYSSDSDDPSSFSNLPSDISSKLPGMHGMYKSLIWMLCGRGKTSFPDGAI